MSEFAFDVSIQDFEAKVLLPAETVPVVVDFWAPWCEPCKVLKPMLEKLAEEYKGRFLLAMVNSDENPELAQHFGVRSIPSVKVLSQGQLVDEFNGVLPESQIREFLDRIALPAGPGGNLREEAAALVAEGKLEEALARLVEASKAKPDDQAVQLDAIDVLLQLGRNDEAKQLLAGNTPTNPTVPTPCAPAWHWLPAPPIPAKSKPGWPPTRPTTPPVSNSPTPMLLKAVSAKRWKPRWKSPSATASSTKAPAARRCCNSSKRLAAASSTTT